MMFTIVDFLSFFSVLIYAVFYFRKSFDLNLGYFLAYLFFMFSFEMITYYKVKDNLFIYNILTFLEFNCLLFFLKEILIPKSIKKNVIVIISIFNIIYACSFIYYLIIGCYFTKYNLIASISGSVLLTVTLFLYFKEFLVSNEILNFKKTLSFWVAVGLLIYYLGTIPITSIINSLGNISSQDIDNLFKIQIVLSILMHSCFIFGALWSQKKVK